MRVIPVGTLIAHADWSLHPGKRWLAVASRTERGWAAEATVPVGDLPSLIPMLRQRAGDAPVLLGIDTPIGLPIAYAERAGITSFRAFLVNDLGHGKWADFAFPAVTAAEINLWRPFYPHGASKKGEVSLHHLVDGLGVTSAIDLRRECELASPKLPGILFWTLGANQTGKAALRAWTELIRPALADDPSVKLWPFDGELPELIATGRTVVAETYPAAAANLLAIPVPLPGKTSQTARRTAGLDICRTCGHLGITQSIDLHAQVADGFGPKKDGEDPFDAVLGLLGMIAVATTYEPSGIPTSDQLPHVRSVEGWILGVPCALPPMPTEKDAEPRAV